VIISCIEEEMSGPSAQGGRPSMAGQTLYALATTSLGSLAMRYSRHTRLVVTF
jgi:hypothetical protein